MPELGKKQYETLRTFLHDVEMTERIKQVQAKKRSNDCDNLDFVFFEDVMEKVQEREGRGEVQWVLKGYAEEWREARRARSGS